MIYSQSHLKTELKGVLTIVIEGNYQHRTLEVIDRIKAVKNDAKYYVKGNLLIDILLIYSLILQVTKANHHVLWHTQISTPEELIEFKKIKEESMPVIKRFYDEMDKKFDDKEYVIKVRDEFF